MMIQIWISWKLLQCYLERNINQGEICSPAVCLLFGRNENQRREKAIKCQIMFCLVVAIHVFIRIFLRHVYYCFFWFRRWIFAVHKNRLSAMNPNRWKFYKTSICPICLHISRFKRFKGSVGASYAFLPHSDKTIYIICFKKTTHLLAQFLRELSGASSFWLCMVHLEQG